MTVVLQFLVIAGHEAILLHNRVDEVGFGLLRQAAQGSQSRTVLMIEAKFETCLME